MLIRLRNFLLILLLVIYTAVDDLLFTKQVADEYQLNYGTLRYWRSNDQGPACFTLGPRGRVVYRRSEVERWLAKMEETTRRGGDDADQVTA